MADIKISDAEGFYAWARFMVENQDSFFISEEKILLNFYNGDDSAYLVLDVYSDETTITQYLFIARYENERNRTALLIFDFLKTLDFSLSKLLAWLDVNEFSDNGEGFKIYIDNLEIARRQLRPMQKKRKGGNIDDKAEN